MNSCWCSQNLIRPVLQAGQSYIRAGRQANVFITSQLPKVRGRPRTSSSLSNSSGQGSWCGLLAADACHFSSLASRTSHTQHKNVNCVRLRLGEVAFLIDFPTFAPLVEHAFFIIVSPWGLLHFAAFRQRSLSPFDLSRLMRGGGVHLVLCHRGRSMMLALVENLSLAYDCAKS